MAFNNTTVPYDSLTDVEKVLAVVIYSIISVLAIGGNACVVYLVLKFQKLRSPTNYLIANLAVADFSMALLCIPFSYWPSIILSYWPFGYLMCKFINSSQVVSIMSSAYTLVAICMDRFVAIMFPLKASLKLTKARALFSIGAIWLGSGVVALPLVIVLETTIYEDGSLQCLENWWLKEAESAYTLALMVIQFAIPFVVFIVTYTGIGLRLWYSSVPGEGNEEIIKDRKDSVKKMIPTMMIVTLLFAVSWIPINVLNIWGSLEPDIKNHKHILRFWWGCHLIAMSHSFVNPVIYVIRNKRFRDGFAYSFRWMPCVQYSGNLHRHNMTQSTYASTGVNYIDKKNCVRLPMSSVSTYKSSVNGGTTDRLLSPPNNEIEPESESMLSENYGDYHRPSID